MSADVPICAKGMFTIIFFCSGTVSFPGSCLDSHGQDQNTGISQLVGVYETGEGCLAACESEEGASGCEYHAGTKTCHSHTHDVDTGNGDSGYTCYVLEQIGGCILIL